MDVIKKYNGKFSMSICIITGILDASPISVYSLGIMK